VGAVPADAQIRDNPGTHGLSLMTSWSQRSERTWTIHWLRMLVRGHLDGTAWRVQELLGDGTVILITRSLLGGTMYFGGRRCEPQEKNTGSVPGSSGLLPDNVPEGFGLLPVIKDNRMANDSSAPESPPVLQFLTLPPYSCHGKGTPAAGWGRKAAGPLAQPGCRMERTDAR